VLLVILGAGASCDSGGPAGHTESRPPLASELFEQRGAFDQAVTHFPACRAILARLRSAGAEGGGAVEAALRELQAQEDEYPERKLHIAAVRFYLQEIIEWCSASWLKVTAGITNYVSLVDILAAWRHRAAERVVFVTFNYDRLLEQALTDVVSFDFQSLEDYVKRDDFTLIKPHGSVNWGRVAPWKGDFVRGPGARDMVLAHIQTLEVTNEYRLMTSIDDVWDLVVAPGPAVNAAAAARLPAIAIPVDRKNEFECPTDHLETLNELLPEVRKVVIIGWRATEEHFLRILQDKFGSEPRKILVVAESEDSAASTTQNLVKAGINKLTDGSHYMPETSGVGMTGLVHGADSDVLGRFLGQPAHR
jgi:hypothetical protein